MGKKHKKNLLLLFVQRLWITMELFSKHGLKNHAAAGAFGFLFAVAPALIIISFFVNRAFIASPELTRELFQSNNFLSGFINPIDLVNKFLSYSGPGLAGIISSIAIVWTVWLCALSIQRGILVIFPRSHSKPFRKFLVVLALAFIIILFIFIMLVGSRFAFNFYSFSGFPVFGPLNASFLALPIRILQMVYLPLMTLAAYRFIPQNPPKMKHIIIGVALCIIFQQIFSAGFALIIGPDRYNMLYGTLGRLFLFLINVYFFFTFFFYGAQMIMTLHHSDALLFIRFRSVHFPKVNHGFAGNKKQPGKISTLFDVVMRLPLFFKDILFKNIPGPLKKYLKTYKEGETVFLKGSKVQEVYYLVSGEAGVYLESEFQNRITVVKPGHFFGVMEVIIPQDRVNSIKAETDLSVMRLPTGVFHAIIRMDPDTDQNIIKTLSERIKTLNKRVVGN